MINLSEFHNYVAHSQPNICQMTVIQNGQTVFSDTWSIYKTDDTVHTMSVTKSIVSLLVGIAVEQGLIGGADDYVLDYFPAVSNRQCLNGLILSKNSLNNKRSFSGGIGMKIKTGEDFQQYSKPS